MRFLCAFLSVSSLQAFAKRARRALLHVLCRALKCLRHPVTHTPELSDTLPRAQVVDRGHTLLRKQPGRALAPFKPLASRTMCPARTLPQPTGEARDVGGVSEHRSRAPHEPEHAGSDSATQMDLARPALAGTISRHSSPPSRYWACGLCQPRLHTAASPRLTGRAK